MLEFIFKILSFVKGGKNEPLPAAPNYVLRCEGMSYIEPPTKLRRFAVIEYSNKAVRDRIKGDSYINTGKVPGNVSGVGFGKWSSKRNQYKIITLSIEDLRINVRYYDNIPNNIVHFEFVTHSYYELSKTTKQLREEEGVIREQLRQAQLV